MPITRVITGGYAEEGAEGLRILHVDEGGITDAGAAASIVNVSAGVRIPFTDHWLFVDESAGRVVLTGAANDWRILPCVPSGGDGPCHLALDADATMLAVANYDSGTVTLFAIDADGHPLLPPALHQNSGKGPDPDRQEGPHAHWVGFGPDGRLYVTDLGIDRVLAFPVDATTKLLGEPQPVFVAPPGSGPRQLAFHPSLPVAYLVSELASTLTVLGMPDTSDSAAHFTVRQTLSTLPANSAGENLAGAIAMSADGRYLYVTNRGHDSVAAFRIGPDGSATLIGHAPSGGSSPRYLLLLPDRQQLLVAHEKSGGVTVLPVDTSGLPHPPIARADMPGAAFLALLDADDAPR